MHTSFHCIYVPLQPAGRSVAPANGGGGKSGQHRAPCFLTGRPLRKGSSVTENNRPV